MITSQRRPCTTQHLYIYKAIDISYFVTDGGNTLAYKNEVTKNHGDDLVHRLADETLSEPARKRNKKVQGNVLERY